MYNVHALQFYAKFIVIIINLFVIQEDDDGHQVVLNIIQDLMKKESEIFLEHFARLGLFGRVLALAGSYEEEEGAIGKEEKVFNI